MSHHARHKGLHHAHGAGAGGHDSHGWVEGITALKEGDRATELLADVPSLGMAAASAQAAHGAAISTATMAAQLAATKLVSAAWLQGRLLACNCLAWHCCALQIQHSRSSHSAAWHASQDADGTAQGASPDTQGGSDAAGTDPVVVPLAPVAVTRDEDFEACMEHALGLMVKEVRVARVLGMMTGQQQGRVKRWGMIQVILHWLCGSTTWAITGCVSLHSCPAMLYMLCSPLAPPHPLSRSTRWARQCWRWARPWDGAQWA